MTMLSKGNNKRYLLILLLLYLIYYSVLGISNKIFLKPGDSWVYFFISRTNSNIVKAIVKYGTTDAGVQYIKEQGGIVVYDYVAKPFFVMLLTCLNLLKSNMNWAIYLNLLLGLFFIVFYFNFLKAIFKEDRLAFLGTLLLTMSVQFNMYVNSGLANIGAIFLFTVATYSFFAYNRVRDLKYYYMSFVLWGVSVLFHPNELFFVALAFLFVFLYSIKQSLFKNFVLGALCFILVLAVANAFYFLLKKWGFDFYYSALFQKELQIPVMQMVQHYIDSTVLDPSNMMRNFLTYVVKLFFLEGGFYFLLVSVGLVYMIFKFREQYLEKQFVVFITFFTYLYYVLISRSAPVNRNISQLMAFFPIFYVMGFKLLRPWKILRFVLVILTILSFAYLNSAHFIARNGPAELADYLKKRGVDELYVSGTATMVGAYGIKIHILNDEFDNLRKGDYLVINNLPIAKFDRAKLEKWRSEGKLLLLKTFRYDLIRDIIREKYLSLFERIIGKRKWITQEKRGLEHRNIFLLYKIVEEIHK